MKVGHKVRELREAKRLTQEQMAELLKMSVNGYGKIERNEVDVNIERLQQLSQALDTPLEEIISNNSPIFNNYGTHQNNFSIIQEQSTKIEKLYDEQVILLKDKIKLLEEKVAWLEKR